MKTEKEVKPKKKAKMWLIVGLFFLTALVWGIASQIEPPADNNSRVADKSVSLLKDVAGVSEENAKGIIDMLSESGIEYIEKLEATQTTDGISFYKLHYKGLDLVMGLTESGKLNDLNMYMRFDIPPLVEEGVKKYAVSDFQLSTTERSALRTESQMQVQSILKSPSTAKFAPAGEWKYGRTGNVVTVSSYVDSQNSFGAIIRSEFAFIYDITDIANNNFSITYFAFDGEVVVDRR